MRLSAASFSFAKGSAAALLLLCGCGVLSGLDELVEGSSPRAGGDNDAGVVLLDEAGRPIDASNQSTDSGTALKDAPQGDQQTAPNDAQPDVLIPPLGFCASLSPPPTLCTDFDDATLGPWEVRTNGAATATNNASTSSSSPRSVFFDVPTNSTTHAYLRRSFAQPASEITVGFSVRLAELNIGSTDYEFAVIRLGSGPSGPYELQLERVGGMLSVEEEVPQAAPPSAETDFGLGIPWALDSWRRVEMRVVFGAGSSSTITVTAAGAAPVVRTISAHLFKAAPTIIIGFDNDSNGVKTYYDDVVVNIK